jgi:DNA adenine methylase
MSIKTVINSYKAYRTAGGKDQTKATPFIQWVGGKRQLLERYMKIFPEKFNDYYEPFLGGGSMFFHFHSLYGDKKNYFISDLNQELVISYNEIKNNPTGVKKLYNEMYERHTKEFFYDIRNIDRKKISDRKYEYSYDVCKVLSSEELAARFIYLNKTCFNAIYRVNKSKLFNVPIGTSLKKNFSVGNLFDLCSKSLKNVDIVYQSYTMIEKNVQAGDFVYLDPPYAPMSATANFTSYTKEGFDVSDQKLLKEFCDRLDKKGALFAVSNSNCELIRTLYKDYKQHVFVVNRNLNSDKKKRKNSTEEILITNF